MRLVPLALFFAAFALTGCPGGGGQPATISNGAGDGSGDGAAIGSDEGDEGDESETRGNAAARLVALLDEVVARVEAAEDCDELASALSSWTNRNKETIDQLIDAIADAANVTDATAEEFDDKVVSGYLVVVEAAADCGSNDAAMRAYEAFNSSVEKATY